MIISRAAGWTDDYWSNDFDPDKDCAQEEKIAKLQNQVKLPSSRGLAHPMGGGGVHGSASLYYISLQKKASAPVSQSKKKVYNP